MDKTDSLLLLHGALATKYQFDALMPHLKDHVDLHRLTFEGHGEKEKSGSTFSMRGFADQVIGYLDENNITTVHLFGYSMGGYVALTLAKQYPDRVKQITTLGTILEWNRHVAERECKLLNPQKMSQKIPHFVDQLKEQHACGWKKVVDNTKHMLCHLGEDPLIDEDDWSKLNGPIQLLIGDKDGTGGLKSTVSVYKKLPNARLGVLPNTPHPFEKVNKPLLSTLLVQAP